MRISGDRKDPGYLSPDLARHCVITMNGEKVDNMLCITADERLGELTMFIKDEAGRYVKKNGVYQRKTVYGRVKISFPGYPDIEEKLRRP